MKIGSSQVSTCVRITPFILLLFLAGCESKVERAMDEVIEQTYQVKPAATLSIRNPNGSIEIHGTNTTEVQLRATKKAKSAAQLKNIGMNVTAQPDAISVTSTFLRQKNAANPTAGTIAYSLAVPTSITLHRVDLDDGKVLIEGMLGPETRVSVVDGQLAIHNCFGNAYVTVANGALELFYDRFDGHQFSVDAQMTNGNAQIFIPRDGSFHVRAETIAGKIVNELDDQVELNGRASRKIDVAVGKSERAEINLRVTSGDIRIAEAKAESDLGR
jgi:DUF4097 and DUF4098 domain-containing protein YvlB